MVCHWFIKLIPTGNLNDVAVSQKSVKKKKKSSIFLSQKNSMAWSALHTLAIIAKGKMFQISSQQRYLTPMK